MNNVHSDALVFFGATGDLAYKKIFPSLQAMVKRGHLTFPWSGSPKRDGISISLTLARRTVWRNMAGSIRPLSRS